MDDSGHYYKRDGTPCYEVPKKGGGMRSINLAWDKPLQLVPSVTTVLQVAPKPQLAVWKENQMMMAALTTERREGEADPEFIARVRKEAFQQVDDACDIGTEVHDACEQYYRGLPVPPQWAAHVEGVAAEVARMFPHITDWVAEDSFAHPLGYGGRVDLFSPSTGTVVDFKGKDGDFTDGKKLNYDQHYQLAAYQEGLRLPRADCANVFFSRTHPGVAKGVVWTEAQISAGWEFFQRALALWICWKKYDPSFEPAIRSEAA